MTMFLATLYLCATLRGGEALACNAQTATEPPRQVKVFAQMYGPHIWPKGVAFIDCGKAM